MEAGAGDALGDAVGEGPAGVLAGALGVDAAEVEPPERDVDWSAVSPSRKVYWARAPSSCMRASKCIGSSLSAGLVVVGEPQASMP